MRCDATSVENHSLRFGQILAQAGARFSVNAPPTGDPLVQLADDLARARAAEDPCADRCYFATVTADGGPALRTLVLRGVETGRLEIYFSATSPKWRQLQANPQYELLVYWPTLSRQYRVSGGFEQISQPIMARYWKHKGRVGKQLDLYYSAQNPQSSPLDEQDGFESAMERIREMLEGDEEVKAPQTLRGLWLIPWRVELLDLSGGDGMHRRCLYTNRGDGWECRGLVP